mmetsp:Transcript_105856/g.275524  ORF Transcript_105856/g.275524 Transcript_105856/m.275524 type:complete len:112 (-) Transcript_105856:47-382(-)
MARLRSNLLPFCRMGLQAVKEHLIPHRRQLCGRMKQAGSDVHSIFSMSPCVVTLSLPYCRLRAMVVVSFHLQAQFGVRQFGSSGHVGPSLPSKRSRMSCLGIDSSQNETSG